MGAVLFDTILFDLGAVLVDWNPRYLYRAHFNGDEKAMEHFLAEIAPSRWNLEIDAGKTFDQGVGGRIGVRPDRAAMVGLWGDGGGKMLREEIAGSGAIIGEL